MKETLRRITLSRQGLASSQTFGQGTAAVLRVLERLGYVQIDTLSVIERAHHHILWTRIPDYQPDYLNQLMKSRDVYEYWFHAASYLPMRDFRFSLRRMASIRNGAIHYFKNVDQRLMREIRDRIQSDGPLKARDLRDQKSRPGSWWNWGPAKRALDTLFMQGDVMVLERNGMEKVYDLTERILPDGVDLTVPSLADYAAYLVERALAAHGFATWKQLVYLQNDKGLKEALRTLLNEKIADGSVIALNIEGMPTIYAEALALEEGVHVDSCVRLLSPFDGAIIHRERLDQLFSFNYRLECYVPVDKRQYGYFCLPILFGEKFIGRMDCKAHRKEKRLEVLSLHIEDETIKSDSFIDAFVETTRKFAHFNGCPDIDIQAVFPQNLQPAIRQAF